MSNSQIAGPDTTQKHVQLLLIGVFTFLAGLYAAGGHMRLFVAMLAVPVIGSVLLAVGKPGETPRR